MGKPPFDGILLKKNIFIKPYTPIQGYYFVISRKPLPFFDRQASPRFLELKRKIMRSKAGIRLLGNIEQILGYIYADAQPLSSLSRFRNSGPYEQAVKDGIGDEDSIASIDNFYPLDNIPEDYRQRGIGTHVLDLLLADLKKQGIKWVLVPSMEAPFQELLTKKKGFRNIGRNYYSKLL